GDEVLGDHGRVLLVQGPQLAEDLLVEFAARDAFGDLGFLDAGAAGALLACVFAGVGLARGAAIVVTAPASPTTVVIATLALVPAPTVVVPTPALITASAVVVPPLTLTPPTAVLIATLALVPAPTVVVPALPLITTAAVIVATFALVPAPA